MDFDCDDYDYEPYEPFDEYNDPDATDCANGDYNVFEENQVAADREHDDSMADDMEAGVLDPDEYENDRDYEAEDRLAFEWERNVREY